MYRPYRAALDYAFFVYLFGSIPKYFSLSKPMRIVCNVPTKILHVTSSAMLLE